jgi:hypothetical protein
MDADVHEHAVRPQHPGRLPQHRRVAGHVGMGHHGDDGGDGAGPQRQLGGIGPGGRQAPAGMPQHPRRQVDAERRPAERAQACGPDAGTAADLQARAAARAEQLGQGMINAERVAAG